MLNTINFNSYLHKANVEYWTPSHATLWSLQLCFMVTSKIKSWFYKSNLKVHLINKWIVDKLTKTSSILYRKAQKEPVHLVLCHFLLFTSIRLHANSNKSNNHHSSFSLTGRPLSWLALCCVSEVDVGWLTPRNGLGNSELLRRLHPTHQHRPHTGPGLQVTAWFIGSSYTIAYNQQSHAAS